MNEKEVKKLVKRQEDIITILTNDDDYYLDLLEEFYDISVKLNFKEKELK